MGIATTETPKVQSPYAAAETIAGNARANSIFHLFFDILTSLADELEVAVLCLLPSRSVEMIVEFDRLLSPRVPEIEHGDGPPEDERESGQMVDPCRPEEQPEVEGEARYQQQSVPCVAREEASQSRERSRQTRGSFAGPFRLITLPILFQPLGR